MILANHILALCAVSYTVAEVNIYLEGPVMLLDCGTHTHDGHFIAGSTAIGHSTEEPAHATTFIHACEETTGSTMKTEVSEEPVDYEAFYAAARDGDIDYIITKLEEGNTSRVSNLLTWQGGYNWTALHAASDEGHVPVVVALLEAGASPNYRAAEGWTPLHFAAARWGHTAVLRALLQPQYQANVNQQSDDGWTPLMLAVALARTEAVEVILANSADPNMKYNDWDTPLTRPSSGGHINIINALLKGGQYGGTALYLAARRGRDNVAQLLLQNGADPNLGTSTGNTPLMIATKFGHVDTAQVLITAGARLEGVDKDGLTALYYAARENQPDVAKLLLQNGAEPNTVTSNGYTPLMMATGEGHVDTVQVLIMAGARLDDVDKDGRTALYHAADWNHPDVAKLLLQNGADKWHQDMYGDTAADNARDYGYDEVADLIDNWQ